MTAHPFLELPQTEIATGALRLATASLPEFVLAHCVRSFVYGRELATARGLRPGRDYDEELLFLCAVLHDLGVSEAGPSSPDRFEVHGAFLAVEYARSAGLAPEKLAILWDAVALHTSVGIAGRHPQPEVAVSHLGISADIIGFGREGLSADLVAAVHERYPRQDLGHALADLIVEHARQRPEKALPLSFPGHLAELYAEGATTTWFDLVKGAGWGDSPVGAAATEGAGSPEELGAEFTRRLAAGDVDGLAALYDLGAVFVPDPSTVVRGRAQVREVLAGMVRDGVAVELELQLAHVVGDHALTANRATVRTPAGVQIVTSLEVCRRRADGRWFYLVDDPTFLAPAGDPAPAGDTAAAAAGAAAG